MGVVELWILLHPRLLVHRLEGPLDAQIRIEEDPRFTGRCADHNLIYSPTPTQVSHRCLAYRYCF